VKIKELSALISEEKSKGKILYKIIVDHEKTLSGLIANESIDSNLHFMEIHEKLEREIYSFLTKYKLLKKDVYTIVEKIIEKKTQKKLI
jgi:alanyl-tRNA synthetase